VGEEVLVKKPLPSQFHWYSTMLPSGSVELAASKLTDSSGAGVEGA
jgi:hypothetical protein